MCIHHLVLGTILNDYNVCSYFNKDKTGIKIVISPKKEIPNKLPQVILDMFLNEYKKYPEFKILDKIQYQDKPVDKTTKNEFSTCLDVALHELLKGEEGVLCLSPLVINNGVVNVNLAAKTTVTNLNVINHTRVSHFYLELNKK